MSESTSIRLTQLTKRGGCASKQPPGNLLPLLAKLPPITDPRVLIGSSRRGLIHHIMKGSFQLRLESLLPPEIPVQVIGHPEPPETVAA